MANYIGVFTNFQIKKIIIDDQDIGPNSSIN